MINKPSENFNKEIVKIKKERVHKRAPVKNEDTISEINSRLDEAKE